MPMDRRAILEWGKVRLRALRGRRGVRRGCHIVWHESGWVRLESHEVLGPGPRELLVRTNLSAVSPGTERALYNRLPNTQVHYPFTPGYAATGTIVEVGSGVQNLRPGDRVAGQLPHSSLAVVPAHLCATVPDGVGDLEAAFLALGVIALQGARKAGIRWGDRVAVLGRGVLGVLAARIAIVAGASGVVLRGRMSQDADGELGLRNRIDAPGARDGYDIVLDVSGNPEAISRAARLVVPGGRIVLIGSSRGTSPALSLGEAGGLPFEIRGAHAQMRPGKESTPGRWTFEDEADLYLDLVASGCLVPFEPPVERIDPREPWAFYRRLGRGEPRVGAAVFDWERLSAQMRFEGSSIRFPARLWRKDPLNERKAERSPRMARWQRRRQKQGPYDSVRVTRGLKEGGRMLRIAMVGCGEIALKNAQAVSASGAAEIRWAVDPDRALSRDLARRFGGNETADAEQALSDPEVDAVFICTPHHLHVSLGLKAARLGKHLIVEKPLARSALEAATLIQTAREAGVLLSTCYPMRFLPQTVTARALIREGGLGRIVGMRIADHLYREMSYWYGGASGRSRSTWRSSREQSGGGVLLMNLCHYLDAMLFVTGLRARRVYCELDRFSAPGDVEDLVALTVRMEGGPIASLEASTCAPGGGERAFQIWGDDGQVALDDPPRFLSLKKTSVGNTGEWRHLPTGGEHEARTEFVRAYAAAALRASPNPADPESSLAVQALIDAAYESARLGAPVDLFGQRERPIDVVSGS